MKIKKVSNKDLVYNALKFGDKTVTALQLHTGLNSVQIHTALKQLKDDKKVKADADKNSAKKYKPYYVYSVVDNNVTLGTNKNSFVRDNFAEFSKEREKIVRFQPFLKTLLTDAEVYAEAVKGIKFADVEYINLRDQKLSQWFKAIIDKNSNIQNIGNRLAEIIGYCLDNKTYTQPDYDVKAVVQDIEELEIYLLSLARMCNDLKNTGDYWDRTTDINTHWHLQSRYLFGQVRDYSLAFKARLLNKSLNEG
jgi:hypothetical protein